ncbi:MAG: helix-turn-helix domain-containing protein [Acidimicrobiales bacterium]
MADPDKRTRLAQAGAWLRETRERRGFHKVVDFAREIGVDPSMVSNYELGKSAVDDERAEQIAAVLRMPILEVRRGLHMWVPDQQPVDIGARRREERINELRQLIDQARGTIDELGG